MALVLTARPQDGPIHLLDKATGEIEVNRSWLEGLDDTSRVEILRYSGVMLPALLVVRKNNQDAGNGRCDIYELAATHRPGPNGALPEETITLRPGFYDGMPAESRLEARVVALEALVDELLVGKRKRSKYMRLYMKRRRNERTSTAGANDT